MAIVSNESLTGNQPSFRIYAIMGACIGWLALLLQFYLIIANRTAAIPETIVRFFSYFTILSNILITWCFTCSLLQPVPGKGAFFRRPSTLAAAAVYITIVGLVYNIILRPLWDPKGLQKLADELLHSVIPILFFFFWLIYIPKKRLQWSNAFPWLLFPFIYIIYTVIRGAITKFYPYPFVDVNAIGYSQLLINSLIFLFVFLGISLLFIGIGKWGKRSRS